MAGIDFFLVPRKNLKNIKKYNLKLSGVMAGEVQKAKLKGRYIGPA
ncbi:hypothetical protein YDYSY3_18870 [Paenibacillus chitinolyticus]|nr:hypothetical protein [Paenibacillus chitinolyticus]GKS10887.1 hypothetical protein YDYSY3_18870 [Paenibacillus chitinolyticus]